MVEKEWKVGADAERRPTNFIIQSPADIAETALAKVEQERLHAHSRRIFATSSAIVGPLLDDNIGPQEILPSGEEAQILQKIKEFGYITIAGACAFGNTDGTAAHAVSTYVDVILKPEIELTQLPDITQLLSLADSFEFGYVKYIPDSSTGKINIRRLPIGCNNSLSKLVQSFISGNTPQVIKFAREVCRFDEKTGPMIRDLVSKYPFNNLAFRSQFAKVAKGGYSNLEEFYREIISDRKEFFETYGGDCTLFSLELADRLCALGLDPTILTYPSTQNKNGNLIIIAEDGHIAALVEDPESLSGNKYYIDPGYGVPWAVPLNHGPISVYPRRFGDGKKIVPRIIQEYPEVELLVDDVTKRHLAGKKEMSVNTLQERAHRILAETHYSKDIIKWDCQDKLGRRIMGIRYSCSERTLKCIEAGIEKVPLQQFFEDSTLQKNLRDKCAEIGADFNLIFGELQYLPQN